jgi:hypothetical protein
MAKGELFKELPTWAKGVVALIVVGGAGVIIYTIYKKVANIVGDKNDRQQLAAEKDELSNIKPPATISKGQAEAMANAIFTALDGYASDEDAVNTQFSKLKNNADWLLLSQAYGTREVSSGRLNPAPNYTGTLIGALNDELSASERAEANAILRKNGVTYTI